MRGRLVVSLYFYLLDFLHTLYILSPVKLWLNTNLTATEFQEIILSWRSVERPGCMAFSGSWVRRFPLCKLNFYTRFSLKVWDTQTGCLQFSCKHSGSEYILSCDVSQDDSKLLSGSVDRYAKVNYGL